ncbi:hypothetical protein BC833DRAFT_590016 [Globomyces pollinis-pini]|nr:hypothetical protein BC833DRAFT_590016 [Globomyces pollinis-pini]
MVDCPICFEPIKHKDINRHIDTTHLTNSLLSSKKQNKSQNNLIMTAADSDFDKKTPLVTDLQTAPSPIKIMKRTSRNTNPKYRPVIIDDEITPNLQENGSNKLPIPITQPQILTDLPPFSSTDNFARLERDSVKKSTQDYKPTIAYHLYKDNKIRALLQNEALSSYGDRSSLIKRHSQWIMMFNANCDSSQPKSLKELRSDLNDWEQLNATRTTQPQNSNHELTKEYQNSITNHLFKYKEHFEELIEEIKARKSNCKKKNPEIEKDIKS